MTSDFLTFQLTLSFFFYTCHWLSAWSLKEMSMQLCNDCVRLVIDRYIGGSLDPTLWLQNPRSMPLHQMVAQHRVQQTMSGDTVIEFILCMKMLLSCHGDLQHSCILCKKLLPTRWMIILCEGCEHTLIGGGGRDTLRAHPASKYCASSTGW